MTKGDHRNYIRNSSEMWYAVVSFTNPLEALHAAEVDAPDLPISDVMMPELSGVELAIQMRKQTPRCKVLLFSGQASTADLLAEARRKGYTFHLLSKPVHPSDLLKQIRSMSLKGPKSASFAVAAD
jgi:CheY-like chemotaxis protein